MSFYKYAEALFYELVKEAQRGKVRPFMTEMVTPSRKGGPVGTGGVKVERPYHPVSGGRPTTHIKPMTVGQYARSKGFDPHRKQKPFPAATQKAIAKPLRRASTALAKIKKGMNIQGAQR